MLNPYLSSEIQLKLKMAAGQNKLKGKLTDVDLDDEFEKFLNEVNMIFCLHSIYISIY